MTTIKYYKPFENFRNQEISSEEQVDEAGNFEIKLDLKTPSFVKFNIYDQPISLLLEPNDTIHIEVDSTQKQQIIETTDWYKNIEKGQISRNWLFVRGHNAEGHIYYNTKYNFFPITKFYYVQQVMDKIEYKDSNKILYEIEKELKNQTMWLDTLLADRKISSTFYNYMVDDICAAISSEAIHLTDLTLRQTLFPKEMMEKAQTIKKNLFSLNKPTNKTLRFGNYTIRYIIQYYDFLATTEKIDSSMIIIEDSPSFVLAPQEEQDFLWGYSIMACLNFAPDEYDLCKIIHKYLDRYPNGSFADYFREQNLCAKTKQNNIHFVEIYENDLFGFISHFSNKRLLIDLWATWCAPCKIEFKTYDENFKVFLHQNNIQQVFLSIDSDRIKWRKTVESFNLSGYHAIANENLLNSIQDVLYDKEQLSIPRYVLVDENGRILNINMKKPSQIGFKDDILSYFK